MSGVTSLNLEGVDKKGNKVSVNLRHVSGEQHYYIRLNGSTAKASLGTMGGYLEAESNLDGVRVIVKRTAKKDRIAVNGTVVSFEPGTLEEFSSSVMRHEDCGSTPRNLKKAAAVAQAKSGVVRHGRFSVRKL